jgi:phage replication O-like protein O
MEKSQDTSFIKIPNSLYEILYSFRLSGELSLIFHFIVRKTFGFHKDKDHIANSKISEATGLTRGNVSRGLSKLIKHKIVIKTDNFNDKGHSLEINIDTKQWIPLVIKTDNKIKPNKKLSILKKELSEQITTIIKSDNKVLSKVRDTKESKRNSKETIQKKEEIVGSKDPTPKEKSMKFFKNIERVVRGEKLPEVTEFLTNLHSKHQNIGKGNLWTEVKDFCLYWTEKTSDGKRERWELQRTFEVERRLVTWLNKAFNGFSKNHYQDNKPKGKEILI